MLKDPSDKDAPEIDLRHCCSTGLSDRRLLTDLFTPRTDEALRLTNLVAARCHVAWFVD